MFVWLVYAVFIWLKSLAFFRIKIFSLISNEIDNCKIKAQTETKQDTVLFVWLTKLLSTIIFNIFTLNWRDNWQRSTKFQFSNKVYFCTYSIFIFYTTVNICSINYQSNNAAVKPFLCDWRNALGKEFSCKYTACFMQRDTDLMTKNWR